MNALAGHSVSLEVASPRAIAAVRARVSANRVPAVFAEYLNQVYALGRSGAIQLDGQNIFVYRDANSATREVDVEFGVGVNAPFAAIGSVEYVELPVGEVATTTHWGDYSQLGAAHKAVIEWCRANNRALAGPKWEIYGHWTGDSSQRTDVYYLLKSGV